MRQEAINTSLYQEMAENPNVDGKDTAEVAGDMGLWRSNPSVKNFESEPPFDNKFGTLQKKEARHEETAENMIDQSNTSLDKEQRRKENGNTIPISRSHSAVYSDTNSEVFLRPSTHLRSNIMSAVVTPSRSPMEPRKVNSTGDLPRLALPKKSPTYKNKNENMILQLVLPNSGNQNNSSNNNYLSARSIDDILENGHLRTRSRPASFNTHRDYVPNGSYLNHAYSACDLTEYTHPVGTPGGRSIVHTPVSSSTDQDKPTPPDEKKKAFVDMLTVVLSVFYALFNVTLGLVMYINDLINENHQAAEIFSLILVFIAFMYILYLTIDISLYMSKKRKYEKLMEHNTPEEIEMKETMDGHYQFNIKLPQAVTLTKTLSHHYCLNKDRHSTNFYLKLGAAAFCFGHLIHSCLLLGYQILFLTSDSFYECASVVQLVLDFCYPLYSFLLLFFIFKYSNVIINRNVIVARFGVMHCLSSSLCFWLWTIYREILEALATKDYEDEYTATTPAAVKPVSNSQSVELPLTSYTQKGVQVLLDHPISPRRFTTVCRQDENLSAIYRDYSPYLYPFSVEYSILIVGVLYLVWQNIGMCKVEEEDDEFSTRQCRSPSGNKDNMESNVVVHVDCHSSHKGLFGGFTILVLTIVSTILFFIAIYSNSGNQGELGILVNIVTSLIILGCMTIACLLGYRQITKLDLNKAHHGLLDDVLLIICIPAYFFNGIFSIIPAVIYSNVIGSINTCLEVLQVLVQTCFILDGLRRSSNTKALRKKAPGREMVTFLVICNVALWIMQTFEVKSHGMQDNRYDFYGKELWTIMGHLCLPLMMFYRFHASVCFGDIWKYSYEPSGH